MSLGSPRTKRWPPHWPSCFFLFHKPSATEIPQHPVLPFVQFSSPAPILYKSAVEEDIFFKFSRSILPSIWCQTLSSLATLRGKIIRRMITLFLGPSTYSFDRFPSSSTFPPSKPKHRPPRKKQGPTRLEFHQRQTPFQRGYTFSRHELSWHMVGPWPIQSLQFFPPFSDPSISIDTALLLLKIGETQTCMWMQGVRVRCRFNGFLSFAYKRARDGPSNSSREFNLQLILAYPASPSW